MDTEQQEQLETKQERSEEEKDRLLEIYKLHAQLASDITNLKATTYRFYPTLISGLLIIFLTILRYKDNILPGDFDGDPLTAYSMLITGILGASLSWLWRHSVKTYNYMLSRKYAVLRGLEYELEYQFFDKEWSIFYKKQTRKGEKNQIDPGLAYSKAEIYLQRFFILSFGLLTALGIFFTGEHVVYLLKSIFN